MLSMPTPHQVVDGFAYTVMSSSVLYAFLPPWESFDDYPGFQRRYRFVLIFLKAAAINGRTVMSKVYGTSIAATSNEQGTTSKMMP